MVDLGVADRRGEWKPLLKVSVMPGDAHPDDDARKMLAEFWEERLNTANVMELEERVRASDASILPFERDH